MGTRGPVPKRRDHLHGHRSKADLARIVRVAGAAAEAPDLSIDVHPLAASWYESLSDGTEAQFYSPAMWQRARIVAKMLSGVLEADARRRRCMRRCRRI